MLIELEYLAEALFILNLWLVLVDIGDSQQPSQTQQAVLQTLVMMSLRLFLVAVVSASKTAHCCMRFSVLKTLRVH